MRTRARVCTTQLLLIGIIRNIAEKLKPQERCRFYSGEANFRNISRKSLKNIFVPIMRNVDVLSGDAENSFFKIQCHMVQLEKHFHFQQTNVGRETIS